jgi:hypothetical protein
MKIIAEYESFNERRYSNPWVAMVNPTTGKIDFSQQIGGYTGRRGGGEAGTLYVIDPQPFAVYAYGQKDYRGRNSYVCYKQWREDEFALIEKNMLVEALEAAKAQSADADNVWRAVDQILALLGVEISDDQRLKLADILRSVYA